MPEQTIEEYVKEQIELGYTDNTGEPIKCWCGSINFEDKITDRNEHGVLEFNRICKSCGKIVGELAYGQWMI